MAQVASALHTTCKHAERPSSTRQVELARHRTLRCCRAVAHPHAKSTMQRLPGSIAGCLLLLVLLAQPGTAARCVWNGAGGGACVITPRHTPALPTSTSPLCCCSFAPHTGWPHPPQAQSAAAVLTAAASAGPSLACQMSALSSASSHRCVRWCVHGGNRLALR